MPGLCNIKQLFSFNDKLFVCGGNKLFVKEDENFIFVKDTTDIFYQFCNNIFVFNSKTNDLFKLKQNLDYEFIFHFLEVKKVSLAHGGVIVCYNDCATYYINMMTCKDDLQIIQRPYNEDFNELYIYKQLELGCSGLQLKREILIDLFGEEFPNQLKNC
ncbi:Conserved_hypothetical protein [Hexamita inflata]|uniref:Uncharacterized protein n=1 Tax=Hexamita inflata TaxID=28002 RepID=A0ABP1GXY1_9EUKA